MINTYITIPYYLRERFDLKGNELIITALVLGFSQDKESWFKGSTKYVAEWTGIDEKSVQRIMRSLCERQILKRNEVARRGNMIVYNYTFNHDNHGEQNVTRNETTGNKIYPVGEQNVTRDGEQNIPRIKDNIDKDNIDNIIKAKPIVSPSLFPEQQEERITLFANSRYGRMSDGEFLTMFREESALNIDVLYYRQAVSDWSDQANKKRTARGWLATIRNFMRSDKEKNKLHTINQNTTINQNEALAFLNNDF